MAAPVPAPAGRPPTDPRQTATSLIDEAAHRLRLAPLGTLGVYYAGSLPFALGLLYFCADMGRSADAEARSTGAALVLAALFLLMKTAHTVFATRLRAQFSGQPMPRWTPGRLGRVVLVQTGLQAPGLFLMQLAAALIAPLGWVYAFYQNVTVLGDGTPGLTGREVMRRAWHHAAARPKANHAGLAILFGLAFFVWLNLLVAAFVLPQLVRIFTGEENAFTLDVGSLFNTTLFAVSGVLVYLAVDPLIKTFYALRCFYEESARSGDDLLAELRALPPVAAAAAAAEPGEPVATPAPRAGAAVLTRVGLIFLLGWTALSPLAAAPPLPVAPAPAPAPPAPAAQAPRTVSPSALDRSIQDVLRRREFAWRAPRADRSRVAASEKGPFARALDGMVKWTRDQVKSAFKKVRELNAKIRKWLRRNQPEAPSPRPDGGVNPAALLQPMVYAVACLLAVGIGYLVWSVWRGRRRAARLAGRALGPVQGKALPPDLSAEDLLATQLPEDEWLALARKLLAAGERRLALRAMYLSLLAGLGERGLLVVARHKSNRDYLQELRRRARDRPELPGAFGRNVGVFERVWYGSHPVDDGLLDAFQADREQALG